MSRKKVEIKEFLELAKYHPVLDVRSPSEYQHAHIPSAWSLPIFSDEQRAEIGTAYKKVSRADAIKIGFKHFGLQLNKYIETVEFLLKEKDSKVLLVHCWRGGMRSAAMAWALEFYGYNVVLLEDGYKAYRNHVLQSFEHPYKFNVLGGYTGSGKTEILHALKNKGEAVIDLEGIAQHKGSSFGALGMPTQSSQEQFENNLHKELSSYFTSDESDQLIQPQNIWVENESQRIGLLNIPKALFHTLISSPLYILEIPFEERLKFIQEYYGQFSTTDLVSAVLRIQKKLGGLETKNAVQLLDEGKQLESFRILLSYYDRNYLRYADYKNRKNIVLQAEHVDAELNAELLLKNK
jgi:tRNA 2-selenouridine synthase